MIGHERLRQILRAEHVSFRRTLWPVLDDTTDTGQQVRRREATVWTDRAVGQRIGQWVDNAVGGRWRVIATADGYSRIRSTANPDRYLTGSGPGGLLILETQRQDGSQEWRLGTC